MHPVTTGTILVAPNSFKGTLRCDEAAAWMAEGVRSALGALPPERRPDVVAHPVADGGEGTLEAFRAAVPGARILTQPVLDPLGYPRVGRFLVFDSAAVIEVAEASGLHLVPPDRRDPWRATSFGTGQLIRAALRAGCRKIYLGLGGSATVDGGIGLVQALGFRVLDSEGRDVPFGGEGLVRVARVDASGVDPRVREAEFIALADVDNPLCGPQGAAAVFGPQKGASAEMVARLEEGLRRLADVLARDLGRSVAELPGAGAAGGIGAAVAGFLGGRVVPGAEWILDLTGFAAVLSRAVLVITGEGKLDGQTRFGKAPLCVARRARAAGVPVLAIAGALGDGWQSVVPDPVDAVLPVWPELPDEAAAARDAGPRLREATERAVRLLILGGRVFGAEAGGVHTRRVAGRAAAGRPAATAGEPVAGSSAPGMPAPADAAGTAQAGDGQAPPAEAGGGARRSGRRRRRRRRRRRSGPEA